MKFVYDFKEGNKDMRTILGGKGANLAEMTNIGLPVPQGFTISAQACLRYYDEGKKLWDELLKEIDEHLANVEKEQGKKFSDPNDPLLFSVRSGAAISKVLQELQKMKDLPMTLTGDSFKCSQMLQSRYLRHTLTQDLTL